MAAPLVEFPESLARERTVMFELMGTTISGGQSATGQIPITRLDGGGIWKATFADVQLREADETRAWRALAAICDGGAQPIVVPMCDRRHFPAPIVNGKRLTGGHVPYSDGTSHSDGTEFEQTIVRMTSLFAADLRASSLTLFKIVGSDLRSGEHFSINHALLGHRLYRIRTAVKNPDNTFAVTIRPPLRAAILPNQPLEFDHPRCVMRLATPEAMDLVLEMRRRALPTVSFLEAFPPFPE